MFLLIFTVGLSFLLYSVNLSRETAIAQQNSAQLVQTKGSESLILTTSCSSNSIKVSITNSGGVPVQITNGYVSDSSGTLYPSNSLSPPSTPALPVSINTGMTSSVTFNGVSTNCAPRTVGLVTSRGNVFTVSFPPGGGLLTLTPSSGTTGQLVAVTGVGFSPNQQVVFSSNPGNLATFPTTCTTDSNGAIGACSFTVTSTNPGAFQVTATAGTSSGSSIFTVLTQTPSLATALSASVVDPSGSVTDSAQLAGVSSGVTGYIQFYAGDALHTTDRTCPPTTRVATVPTTGSGSYPAGVFETGYPSSPNPYYWYAQYTSDSAGLNVIASSPCEPVSSPTFQATSTTTLTLSPTLGPLGTTVTLTGGGYLSGAQVTSLTFDGNAISCTSAVLPSVCVGGVLTANSPSWVATIVVPTTGGGAHVVQATQSAGSVGALALFNVSPAPTLSISPSTGAPNQATPVTLTGSNYAISHAYDYCLSTSISAAGCLTAAPYPTFTSTAAGGIPTAIPTTLTVNEPSVGSFYVIVFDPSTLVVATSAVFSNLLLTEVANAFTAQGFGFFSFNFNYMEVFGASGPNCAATKSVPGPAAGNCALTPFPPNPPGFSFPTSTCPFPPYGSSCASDYGAYQISSSVIGSQWLVFAITITNADPAGRAITLIPGGNPSGNTPAPGSALVQFATPTAGGGTAASAFFTLGDVCTAQNPYWKGTDCVESGVHYPYGNTMPPRPVVLLPCPNPNNFNTCTPTTVWFYAPKEVSYGIPFSALPAVTANFLYLTAYVTGAAGTPCPAGALCSFGQNLPFTSTLYTSTAPNLPSIALSPTSGPLGTSVTVSGSGFSASSTLTFLYDGQVVATTPSSVTSTAGGAIPPGVTFVVPTSPGGPNSVLVVDSNQLFGAATFTVSPGPTLNINPSSATHGVSTTVTLTGNNYVTGKSYGYCLSTTLSASGCISGTTGTFTAVASAIPSGVTLVANQGLGTYYVLVYGTTYNIVAAYATFSET
jgi:hypothetical protein